MRFIIRTGLSIIMFSQLVQKGWLYALLCFIIDTDLDLAWKVVKIQYC